MKRGFLGGFLVLGFAIFIAGFLTGMLAIAVVPSESDTLIEFLIFALGFVLGLLTIALTWVVVKLARMKESGS